jgi:hypothetical protein
MSMSWEDPVLLLLSLACFDDHPAPVAAGPTLSFVEMPCEYSGTIENPDYILPEGAVVVSAEECFLDDYGLELCQNADWLRASNGFLVGGCLQGYREGTTVIVNYLEWPE